MASLANRALTDDRAIPVLNGITALKYPSTADPKILKGICEELWKLNGKGKNKGMHAVRKAVSGCIRNLTALGELDQDQMSSAFEEQVKAFFTKRDYVPDFFQELVSQYPWLGWSVLPYLLTAATNSRNIFSRLSAFQFIAFLLSTGSLEDHKFEVEAAITKLKEAFAALPHEKMTKPRWVELFKSLNSILESFNGLFPKKVGSAWTVEEFNRVLKGRGKGVGNYNKIVLALGGQLEKQDKSEKQVETEKKEKKRTTSESKSNGKPVKAIENGTKKQKTESTTVTKKKSKKETS